MNCPQLDLEALASRPLTGEERAHAASCPRCQAALAERERLQSLLNAPPRPELQRAILEQAHAELARRPTPRRWERTLGVAALLALAGALPGLLMPSRGDFGSLSSAEIAADLLLPLATFVLGAWAAFGPGLRLRLAVPVGLALASCVALTVMPGKRPDEPAGSAICMAFELGVSALPLLALLLCLRTEELSRGRGLLAALAAGALGEVLLFRHCPTGSPGHIVGVHLLGWAVVLGAGAMLGGLLRVPLWKPKERRP